MVKPELEFLAEQAVCEHRKFPDVLLNLWLAHEVRKILVQDVDDNVAQVSVAIDSAGEDDGHGAGKSGACVFVCLFVLFHRELLESWYAVFLAHGIHLGVLNQDAFFQGVCLVKVFVVSLCFLELGGFDFEIVEMVEIVDHVLDGLELFGVGVPYEVFGVGHDATAGNLDNASLAFLAVSLGAGKVAASQTKELGLRAHNGLVDLEDLSATGNG